MQEIKKSLILTDQDYADEERLSSVGEEYATVGLKLNAKKTEVVTSPWTINLLRRQEAVLWQEVKSSEQDLNVKKVLHGEP